MDFKEYFKDKKVTVMGLDSNGRGVQDVEFLSKHGAIVTGTDLKTEEDLGAHIGSLRELDNVTLVLGEHELENFKDADFVIRAASVPINSKFLNHARENNVEVYTDETLFLKLAPEIKAVGITGTKGKSTVTYLVHYILNENNIKAHLGGNVRNTASLPLLEKIEEGDVVVFELDSWKLQGFGELSISPDISVFTTFFADHMNYYDNDMQKYFDDKSNIFRYQNKDNVLITTKQSHNAIEKYSDVIPSNEIIVDSYETDNPSLLGEHNKINTACAIEVAKQLGISDEDIKKAIETFQGVEGRLQLLKEVNGVKIYNDNNATSPDATIVGLKALKENIILIMGGSDKELDMNTLVNEIPKHCKAVILHPGSGTDKIKDQINKLSLDIFEEDNLEKCVNKAIFLAKKGDTILFSPAFSSTGKEFKNEYDRNDKFISLIKNL